VSVPSNTVAPSETTLIQLRPRETTTRVTVSAATPAGAEACGVGWAADGSTGKPLRAPAGLVFGPGPRMIPATLAATSNVAATNAAISQLGLGGLRASLSRSLSCSIGDGSACSTWVA
jgi:hypothetical protein